MAEDRIRVAVCDADPERVRRLSGRFGVQQQLRQVEEEIDRLAARLWGLTDEELEEIRRALAELGVGR